MLRALRATTASSPREVMMNPTPTRGRNVTSDRSGQWLMARPRSPRHQIPSDQGDDADQHGEGVVVDIAGLQPACFPRQFAGRSRDAVGPEPVDDRRIAGLPQPLAERESGAHEEPVIELVEVPFVEEKQIDGPEPHGQPSWQVWDQRIAD